MVATLWDEGNNSSITYGMATRIGDHWEAKLYGDDNINQRIFVTLVLNPNANLHDYGNTSDNNQSIGKMKIDIIYNDDIAGWKFNSKQKNIWYVPCE